MNTLRRLYNAALKPQALDEQSQRKEFLLSIVLLCSKLMLIGLYFFFIVSHLKEMDEAGFATISFWIFLVLLLFLIALFISARFGNPLLSSYLLVALYYLCISVSAFCWGLDLPEAILGYILTVFISSLLLGTRFGICMTIIICLTIFELDFFQKGSSLSPMLSWEHEPFRNHVALQYAVLLFFIMIISWISNMEMNRSLKRAIQSENDLKKERDSLEQKVEARTYELKNAQIEKMTELYRSAEFGRLSSGLFHDLINPLTSVYLNVSKLNGTDTANASEINDHVEQAVNASKKIEDFIITIRKQINDNAYQTLFSAEKEIRTSLDLLRYKAKEENVDLIFEMSTGTELFGNPLKFSQVVLNLVSNAIDAYHISIKEMKRVVEISLKEKEGLVLEVKDYGSGIAEDILPHIFDPFYTTKDFRNGTGLGLSTAKSIIEKDFGGSIAAKSDLHGTVLTALFSGERIGRSLK